MHQFATAMSWTCDEHIKKAAFVFMFFWIEQFMENRGIPDVWSINIIDVLQYLLSDDPIYIEGAFTEFTDGLEAWLCSGRQPYIAGQLAWYPVADITGYANYFDQWYFEHIDLPCGFPPADKYEALQKVISFYEPKLARGDVQEFFWILRLLWNSYARNFLQDTKVTGSYPY